MRIRPPFGGFGRRLGNEFLFWFVLVVCVLICVCVWGWEISKFDPRIFAAIRIDEYNKQTYEPITPYTQDEGVVFVKTHKTGSSTLTSIFWRNLCENGLKKCFLPPLKTPGKTWDFSKEKDWKLMKNKGGSTKGNNTFPYDAWMYHVVYNRRAFSTIVPSANRVISIVRRPSLRFQSAWEWYKQRE